MNLSFRRLSLENDRAEMLDLALRNFGWDVSYRFDWQHNMSPAGVCWSWFAHDSNGTGKKKPVALVSVFPRYMRVDGRLVRAGQVGEFVVEVTHRSLGPAVQVQRLTFQPVDSGELAFCYDCPPHDQGMSTFVRLGMKPSCEVFRYALPLRCDAKVEKLLGRGSWTKPISGTGNFLLSIRRSRTTLRGVEICKFEDRFGEDFDRLDALAPNAGMVRASRIAADLNWRYRDVPEPPVEGSGEKRQRHTVVARRAGELLAFATMLIQADGIAVVLDIFGLQLAETGPPLLKALVNICREQKVSCVTGICTEDSEQGHVFRTSGFHRREINSRVVAYEKDGTGTLLPGMLWPFGQTEVLAQY